MNFLTYILDNINPLKTKDISFFVVSLNDYEASNFDALQPATEDVPKKIVKELIEQTLPQYMQFIQEKLISDSVEKARSIAQSKGIESRVSGEKPFFVSDEDMGINGAIGNSFAMVKPGKKEKPFRIIIAHSDVPSLRIPVNPVFGAQDYRRELRTPTISLCTEPFGGIRPEDWYGMDVEIVGKIYINGKEKRISMPGRIKQKSLHTDHPLIMKTFEGLKVSTASSNIEELYQKLGIESADDFASARLYCLPSMEKNGKLLGYELGGFGHDDRCCVWAGLQASLETLLDNDNTTMVFALDNEEIGSIGNSANYMGFFENVMRETLKVVYGEEGGKIELPSALNRGLMGGMPAICADVGVGLGPEELDDRYGLVDIDRSSRTGWGIMINAGITTSPKHVDNFTSLLKKKIPGKEKNYRYQIGGDYTPVDGRAWGNSAQMYDSFRDTMPFLNVGIPVCGLHHPRTEVINIFDLQWMKEAYKIYMKN